MTIPPILSNSDQIKRIEQEQPRAQPRLLELFVSQSKTFLDFREKMEVPTFNTRLQLTHNG